MEVEDEEVEIGEESEKDESDSESEDMKAEQEADEEALKQLEKEVTENVYDYQRHVSLIEALRNAGELDRLRSARRLFAATFPLTPKLWLEWINDERRIDTPWEDVRDFFEKAVQDYFSVSVWLEYVQAACSNLTPTQLRELCERALSHVGLHVSDGRLIWDAYRVFETAMVQTNQNGDDSEASTNLLFQIYKRQLSLPIAGLEETLQEFLALFGEEKFDPKLRQAYESATEELRSLMVFENELESNGNSLNVYWKYLDFEEGVSAASGTGMQNEKESTKDKKTVNIARLRCLYERAITDHCLNAELWLRYVGWLDKRFTSSNSIGDIVLPVYERAVRNCTWSTALWIKYALACERSATADWCEKADGIFNRAMDGGYSVVGEAAELWLTRAYQKRRAAHAGLCGYDAVAEVFENGATFLKEKYEDRSWDQSSVYRRAWASYLACPKKGDGTVSAPDLPKARAIWKEILASDGNGRLASVWLEYFNQIERNCGDAKEARKTLYCALNSVSDFPDYVAHALRQFELEHGTLQDLDEAEERIRRQTARLEERKKQQHALTATSKQKQREQIGPGISKKYEKNPEKKPKSNAPPAPADRERKTGKRKNSTNEPEQVPVKQQKLTNDASSVEQQPVSNSNSDPDSRSVFVSNLSFALKEDQLKEVFESQNVGKVVEVRLKKQIWGRSKGFGCVVFQNGDSVAKALAIDRYSVDGRPMYVSPFKKREGDAEHTFKPTRAEPNIAAEKYHFGSGLEKHKLFVRNIPKHATDADLKTIFEPYGEIKSIRVVTFPSGQSKGIAYIEYTNEESASKALLNTDGTFLLEKQLSVALSNPPARRPDFHRAHPNGDQTLMPPPPPPHRMLLPRSLAAPVTTGRKPRLNLK